MGRPHLLGFGGYQILQGDTKFTRKFGTGILNFWGYQIISDTGVTANLFRSANLFRRNLFASGFVPDFQKISEFVPDG